MTTASVPSLNDQPGMPDVAPCVSNDSGGGDSAGRLFLHVGPHKTGSSTLQRVLASNSGRLAARSRCLVTVNGDANAGALAQEFESVADHFLAYGRDRRQETLESARESLAAGIDVIMSGEALSWLTPCGYRDLLHCLGSPRTSVLFGARGFRELSWSIWVETIRSGGRGSYQDWLHFLAENEVEQSRVLPSRKLQAIVEVEMLSHVWLFRAPDALGADCGVRLLESWLELERNSLLAPPALSPSERRAALSSEQLVYQVIFNHVITDSEFMREVAPESFAAQMQSRAGAVREYLFSMTQDTEELLTSIVLSEEAAVESFDLAWLEPTF